MAMSPRIVTDETDNDPGGRVAGYVGEILGRGLRRWLGNRWENPGSSRVRAENVRTMRLTQYVKKRTRFPYIRRLKPFREPAIDLLQALTGGQCVALLVPPPT